MSVQAISWLLDVEQTTRGNERLVLLSLCNHAGKNPVDGAWECWPGLDTILRESRVGTKRTVQRTIEQLVTRGLLEVVRNGAPDSRMRADRKPNLYRVLCDGVTSGVTPLDDDGVTDQLDGVTDSSLRGDRAVSPKPSLEPLDEPEKLFASDDARSTTLSKLSGWRVPQSVVDGQLVAAVELCEQFAEQLEERGVRCNGTRYSKRWVIDMEALLRIDEREPADVVRVLNWLASARDPVSHFWQPNVLSPSKLRMKWDQMKAQYERERKPRPSRQSAALQPSNGDSSTTALARAMGIIPKETHHAIDA